MRARRCVAIGRQCSRTLEHRAPRIHEHLGLAEIRAVEIVRDEVLFSGVVERVQHVEEELDPPVRRPECSRDAQIEQRLRRQPASAGGSSRMRWMRRRCGREICAEAAHGLPLKCCRFAAKTKPVRGTSTDALTRKTFGRSLSSRPRALVRSFGSRPIGTVGSATVLDCALPTLDPLDA